MLTKIKNKLRNRPRMAAIRAGGALGSPGKGHSHHKIRALGRNN
jgi:hypothetical protein